MDTKRNQSYEGLCEAIAFAGTQIALANLLKKYNEKVSQPHIQKWLKSPKGVPANYCVAIENETPVTRKKLRPNDYSKYWPELAEQSEPSN